MEVLFVIGIVGLILYFLLKSPSGVDMKSDPVELIGDGSFDYEIVGESHYQNNIRKALKLSGGRSSKSFQVQLIPEDHNQHDKNAVAVYIDWKKVGYLSRREAKNYRRRMKVLGFENRIAVCGGTVWGGGKGKSYGIWLDYDPTKTKKHYTKKEEV